MSLELETVLEFVSPAYCQDGTPGVAFYDEQHGELFVIPRPTEEAANRLAEQFVGLFLAAIRRVEARKMEGQKMAMS